MAYPSLQVLAKIMTFLPVLRYRTMHDAIKQRCLESLIFAPFKVWPHIHSDTAKALTLRPCHGVSFAVIQAKILFQGDSSDQGLHNLGQIMLVNCPGNCEVIGISGVVQIQSLRQPL